MFDEVICDDEVECPISKCGEIVGTSDDIDRGQLEFCQLLVVLAQLLEGEPIHERDVSVLRQGERPMKCPDFDAVSFEQFRKALAFDTH